MDFSTSLPGLFAIVAIWMASADLVLADKKPKGAKKTDPQTILQLYSGKTSNWPSGGHAFWGPSGEYRAVNRTGNAIGFGQWRVTRWGRLCEKSTWYWSENGARKTQRHSQCWQFVTAPDGTIWERYLPETSDWYKHNERRQVRGDTQRRTYNKLKRDLGL